MLTKKRPMFDVKCGSHKSHQPVAGVFVCTNTYVASMTLFKYRSTVISAILAKTASPAICIYNCIVVPFVDNPYHTPTGHRSILICPWDFPIFYQHGVIVHQSP